jgi:hypothetical protein
LWRTGGGLQPVATLPHSRRLTGIETLACDAGWRNYHFVKLKTDAGVVGWSAQRASARPASAP